MKAVHLQTEKLTNPLGIGNPAPRFSWICEGGVRQTAYRIVCAREGKTVWDSGRVESARMTWIRYEGEKLRSRDRVEWSVTLWDENGTPGEESSAWFELGLLRPTDFTAFWITGDYRPKKGIRYPADCFRRTFRFPGKIAKARLYATARGLYDGSINGRRIGDFLFAPGSTDCRKRIQVQTYDVTDLLGEKNTIELRLADGWYRGCSAAYGVTEVYGRQTSVLAQLEITAEDGKTVTIPTDETWAWSNDGPLRFADLQDGEIVDFSMKPSYSGRARIARPPKNVPLLPSDNVPVQAHERFTGKPLPNRVWDFGQNIAGIVSLTVRGKCGQEIRLVCGELLDKEGSVDLSNMQETRPAKGWTGGAMLRKLLTNQVKGETDGTPHQEIRLICSGGEDHYSMSFSVFGFRYMQANCDGIIDAEAAAVYSSMDETGFFSCSHEGINQLYKNTLRSMKGNFLDVPTDCPTRERLGWTGDAQVFFETGAYLMDTAPFFRKWMRDMEDAQYKNGLLPAVLPYGGVEAMYRATGSSAGWADAVYLIPYRYYKMYGDKDLLLESWPMVKRYAEYLKTKIEGDGHYERGVHLGEWLEPEEFRDRVYGTKAKHPEECTAYLYLAMTTIAEIASILGEDQYRETLLPVAERAKEAYPKYAELDTDRQAKLVRPLALGLYDGETKEKAVLRLKQAAENFNYRVGTGFLSTPFLLPILAENGEAETAYRMLENEEAPGWLHEVKQGATTIWEDWEGKLSRNHYSPGAVTGWLFSGICGIRLTDERRFEIAPIPGGSLTRAEASWRSIYGEIASRWEKRDGRTVFTISVPSNCASVIRLPDGTIKEVSAGRHEYEL